MKWIKTAVLVLVVLSVVLSLLRYRSNSFQRGGELALKGLTDSVKVLRDEKGMAYIYAANSHDAFYAQGFVTAQDRLFQMELTKLFATGRISELAGEGGRETDVRMRTLGFHRNAKKHAGILSKKTREMLQAYLDGVNEYIRDHAKSHHLEFKLAGIKPGPWTIEDSLAVMYYMGWNSAANIQTETVTQMLVEKLGIAKAGEIFPLNINPDDGVHAEGKQVAAAGYPLPSTVRISGDRKLMEYVREFSRPLGIGSNNWTVGGGRASGKLPIVANDPHLDARMLPGPWYPSALIFPGVRAVGVNVPGLPGMVMGRNEYVAMGITNSYGDAQDLYVETIDPAKPDNYLEGGKSLPFVKITETLKIKDKKSPLGFREEHIVIKLTRRGPVISGVLADLKTTRCISVRWSPFETMGSSIGIEDLIFVRSVNDVKKALGGITAIMVNFVFADVNGNIGWQTTGRIPIRSQGEGTVPYEVKGGADNWTGWIPYEKMPQAYNPAAGWVGTCNHKTVKKDYPYYMSSHFSPYYRYARLKELIASVKTTTAEDHWKFQRDIKNLMAEKVAPVLARGLSSYKDTEALAKLLSEWDYADDKATAAPAVFQAVYARFAYLTFKDELGEELAETMLNNWYFWQVRFEKMVLGGKSEWFDDSTTKNRESMADIIHRAGTEILAELGRNHGSDPAGWEWGDMHRLEFVSPIMRKGALKGVLGGGSHPMDGSGETLYRGIYEFNEPFYATTTASMRMVADLADSSKVLAVLPGGVCGRLFDGHTTDQIEPFMNGEKRYWWFSDELIQAHTKNTLVLKAVK